MGRIVRSPFLLFTSNEVSTDYKDADGRPWICSYFVEEDFASRGLTAPEAIVIELSLCPASKDWREVRLTWDGFDVWAELKSGKSHALHYYLQELLRTFGNLPMAMWYHLKEVELEREERSELGEGKHERLRVGG